MPYLYGGRPERCAVCDADEPVAQQCQFGIAGFGICGWMRNKLVKGYLARGVTEILTLTPCDMWPLVAGRTLFFTGDSQTQARPHGYPGLGHSVSHLLFLSHTPPLEMFAQCATEGTGAQPGQCTWRARSGLLTVALNPWCGMMHKTPASHRCPMRRTLCAACTASSTRSPTWAGTRWRPTAPVRARARRASSGTRRPAACTCPLTRASASTAATTRRACCSRRVSCLRSEEHGNEIRGRILHCEHYSERPRATMLFCSRVTMLLPKVKCSSPEPAHSACSATSTSRVQVQAHCAADC